MQVELIFLIIPTSGSLPAKIGKQAIIIFYYWNRTFDGGSMERSMSALCHSSNVCSLQAQEFLQPLTHIRNERDYGTVLL